MGGAPLSSLSLGTMAVLVVVLVPLLSLLLFTLVFIRRHSRTGEREVHCARCHTMVAVSGVHRAPQTLGHLAPLAHFGSAPSVLRRVPQSSPALVGPQVPAVLLRPQEPNPADSATFQRLGMAATPSRLLEGARALESRLESARALTPPPASPPTSRETLLTSGVEVLAPSSPRGARLQFQEPLEGGRLGEVRVLQFLNSPTTRTPHNAARKKRRQTSVAPPRSEGRRTVSPQPPSAEYSHDVTSDYPLLEASVMNRTEVDSGDLDALCETSFMERDSSRGGGGVLTPGTSGGGATPGTSLLTPTDTSARTPASVESASRTLTERSIQEELDRVEAAGPAASGRFVTTREEAELARSIDDVFQDSESESFKQQVSLQSGVGFFQGRGEGREGRPVAAVDPQTAVKRSVSMPAGQQPAPTQRKASLVELLEKQKEEQALFTASFNQEEGRVPPFPYEQRRGSQVGLQEDWGGRV